MSLEEVIGIEIGRSTLSERMSKQGTTTELLVKEDTPSDFKVVRRYDGRFVEFDSIQTRTMGGGWVGGHTAVPTGQKFPPAVVLFDEEIRHVKVPAGAPDRENPDETEGRYYGRTPLGSNIVGSGFAVLFPSRESLRRMRRFVAKDWADLIERFKKREKLDEESIFLVATHEHAELALILSAYVEFAGVVIEAPKRLIFRDPPNDEGSGRKRAAAERDEELNLGFFESRDHLQRYLSYAAMQKNPIQIVVAKETEDFELIKKTLLLSFVNRETDFRPILLENWARRRLRPDENPQDLWGDEEDLSLEDEEIVAAGREDRRSRQAPLAFHYDKEQFETWVVRMLNFMIDNAKTKPLYIPEPDPAELKRREFESIFKRLEEAGPRFDDAGGEGGDGGEPVDAGGEE